MPSLPEPLVPPECDCRGLPFMPLDVVRLRDSDLAALATGEEFKAAVLLWCASWGQEPAASLPSEERILARLAGCSLAEWRSVQEMALRGWVLCSDDRWYHPVIAEKAMEAWGARQRQRARARARWDGRPDTTPDDPAKPPQSRGKDEPMPRHKKNAPAAMQGTETVKGQESPQPPKGSGGLFGDQLDPEPEPPDPTELAVERWNALAQRLGLPKAKVVDDGRRKAIRRRLAEGGLEAWDQALRAVERSRHCRGENDRGWRADIDFVCQPKSWRRLLEGTYGDDAPEDRSATWSEAQWAVAMRIWRQEGQWDASLGPAPGEPGCLVPPKLLVARVDSSETRRTA